MRACTLGSVPVWELSEVEEEQGEEENASVLGFSVACALALDHFRKTAPRTCVHGYREPEWLGQLGRNPGDGEGRCLAVELIVAEQPIQTKLKETIAKDVRKETFKLEAFVVEEGASTQHNTASENETGIRVGQNPICFLKFRSCGEEGNGAAPHLLQELVVLVLELKDLVLRVFGEHVVVDANVHRSQRCHVQTPVETNEERPVLFEHFLEFGDVPLLGGRAAARPVTPLGGELPPRQAQLLLPLRRFGPGSPKRSHDPG